MPFSNIPTTSVTVLTPEQDFFYLPCMSGEKYAPTSSITGSGATVTYTALGLYPALALHCTASSIPTVTWPTFPSWKYSASVFNGYVLSFRLATSSATGGNSLSFLFNPSGDQVIFLSGGTGTPTGIYIQLKGTSYYTGIDAASNQWYSFVVTVDANKLATVTVNGVTVVTNILSNVSNTALTCQAFTSPVGTPPAQNFYISQFQITYT